MDSVNRSSSPCASTPALSFIGLPPQDQLAVLILEQLAPQDKPTLRNIATTNRQIYLLATPSLMQAYIDHAENKMKLMKTSAEKVPIFFMIKQKLAENAGKLPVKVAETLWKRLEGLVLEEVNGLLALYKPHKETDATISSSQTREVCIGPIMTLHILVGLHHELAKALTKPLDDLLALAHRGAMNS